MKDAQVSVSQFELENPFYRLPLSVGWFFGVRPGSWEPHQNQWLVTLSIFLTTMAAVLTNTALAKWAPLYRQHNFTSLVASFGASSVLLYGKPESPFSQPRNFVLGHVLSALIGVAVMRLFCINSHGDDYLWVSGALAVSCASVVMKISGTVHPPCGATALLPSAMSEIRALSWFYLAVVTIHTLVFLGVTLLLDNVYLRYPNYWFFPPKPKKEPSEKLSNHVAGDGQNSLPGYGGSDVSKTKSSNSEFTLHIPSDFQLSEAEARVLDEIQMRLMA